jgi:hypothetical protein
MKLALALVGLLAAATVVPAVAQTEGFLDDIVPANLAQSLSALGLPGLPTDNSNPNNDVANNSSANSSNTSDPSVSTSDPASSSASSSDPANDPAVVSQEFSERRITSGKASPSFSVSNSGDNSNICATGQQVVNTGNVANQQGVSQYASNADDIDLSGSSIEISPSATGTCTQSIEQSAVATK